MFLHQQQVSRQHHPTTDKLMYGRMRKGRFEITERQYQVAIAVLASILLLLGVLRAHQNRKGEAPKDDWALDLLSGVRSPMPLPADTPCMLGLSRSKFMLLMTRLWPTRPPFAAAVC